MSDVGSVHIAVNVAGSEVGGGLGRARTMAVATLNAADEIEEWQEFPVGWDVLHEREPHGSLHAVIVGFMREHDITAVVSGHMGPPMVNTMMKLGVLPLSATGEARNAARDAAKRVRWVNGSAAEAPNEDGLGGNKWILPIFPS